jgi:hypothetical protein
LNVAVTETSEDRVTLHESVPVHAPDHPANVDPWLGVAVNATAVPVLKLALHVCPQLMPEGLLLTVPVPLPEFVTVSFAVVGPVAAVKVAVTVVAAESVTLQAPAPEQPPDHPANVEPWLGVAVSVTTVPVLKVAPHGCPQLMPEGLLLIVPVPVPEF